MLHAETRRPTTVFPQCLGGLRTVQTIYQHKARAVRPNRDRRPLAVVQHTASTRFCSRVVRRFIGMSAIATVSRFIMIEGEDEFTARRPFQARRTNGSSERIHTEANSACNHTLVVPHELGVREGAPCLGIFSLSGGQTTRTTIGSAWRCG